MGESKESQRVRAGRWEKVRRVLYIFLGMETLNQHNN